MSERNSARMCGIDTQQLETSARPAWLWDPARQRIVWANAAAVSLFGEDGLLSLAERSFDAREPGVAALAAIQPALNEAGEKGLPLKLAFPSAGIEKPLDVRVQAHALPDGRPGILVVARVPAMENSPRFGHVLREVLEAMPLAVAVVDEAARLVYANPVAMALVGEEQLGGLRAFFADATTARAFLKRAAEAGLAHLTCDMPADRAGASEAVSGKRRLRITARPSGEEGGMALFTLVIEDITERSRLEKAMERQAWPPLPQAPGQPRHRDASDAVARTVAAAVATPSDVVTEKPLATGRQASPAGDQDEGTTLSPPSERLPLSEEDIRTFQRLSAHEPQEAGQPADAAKEETAPAGEEKTDKRNTAGMEVASADDTASGPAECRQPPSPAPPAQAAEKAGMSAASGSEDGTEVAHAARAVETVPAAGKPIGQGEAASIGPRRSAAERNDEDTPDVPALVRSVLDHRPAPILLHREKAFLYANKAAREIFRRPLADEGWHALLEALAPVADGAVTQLADAEGRILAFRLSRDVFPWRDGAVVQTTLVPLQAEEAENRTSEKRTETTETPPPPRSAPAETTDIGRRAHLADVRHADDPRPAARNAGGRVRILSVPAADGTRKAVPSAMNDQAANHRENSGATPAERPPRAERSKETIVEACMPVEPLDEELRAILDTATDGIITLNRDGEILSFSAGAEALFGLRTAEVVGRPFVELLEGDSRKVVEDYMQALAGGNSLAGIYNEGREVTARVAGGGQIPLFITIGRLGRNDEVERPPNKAAFCVVVRDITQWKKTESELRRAKEEAERSSAMKSEFLAAISHELRTPLNAILGFSDVMRNERFGAIGNEKYKGYANDIYQSGEHLLSLINDLLDLSRIEAGKFELHFEDVDVAAVTEEALNLMKEEAAKEKVILRRAIAADLPRVVADARSLKQILLNLLSNAVKFTGSGGQVVLSARMTEKGELEIAVSDTGEGMTAEEVERALKPFERITGKGRPEKPGTGLGLPLTKALAEANHARFEMESEPGKGTTVRIIFPTQRVLA